MARSGPPAAASPLDDAEFAALIERLGPFERRPRLAVAVSGGADSVGTAVLARSWVHERGGTLLALVVDHGLRAESAEEAALVVERLTRTGIPARRLRWSGDKPRSGIQAAARAARYELLAAACRDAGILHLLLGHHGDDQAETVQLRQRSGSGQRGLAGMAAVREIAGLRLLRPLLAVPKSRLLATLAAHRQPWVEDPSNADGRFARTALRRADVPVLAGVHDIAIGAAQQRMTADHRCASWSAQHVELHPLGFLRVGADALASLDASLMSRLLQVIAGAAWPARMSAVERLIAALRMPAACATLAGCIVRRNSAGIVVAREPAAAGQRLDLVPGSTVRWDGRFEVTLDAGARPLGLRRLGVDGRRRLPALAGRAARRLPAAAVHSLPSLWDGEELLWQPLQADLACPDMPVIASMRFTPPISLAGPPFFGPNVVSMAGPLIYRVAEGLMPSTGEAPRQTGPGMRLGR